MISLEKRDATISFVTSLIFLFISFISNLYPASYSGDTGLASYKDSSIVVVDQRSAELYVSAETIIFGEEQLQNVKIVKTLVTDEPAHLTTKRSSSKTKIKRKRAIVIKANPSSLSSDLPNYHPNHSFENSSFIPSVAVFVTQNQNLVKKYLNDTSSLIRSEAHNSRCYKKACTSFYDKDAVQASRSLFINRGPPFRI